MNSGQRPGCSEHSGERRNGGRPSDGRDLALTCASCRWGNGPANSRLLGPTSIARQASRRKTPAGPSSGAAGRADSTRDRAFETHPRRGSRCSSSHLTNHGDDFCAPTFLKAAARSRCRPPARERCFWVWPAPGGTGRRRPPVEHGDRPQCHQDSGGGDSYYLMNAVGNLFTQTSIYGCTLNLGDNRTCNTGAGQDSSVAAVLDDYSRQGVPATVLASAPAVGSRSCAAPLLPAACKSRASHVLRAPKASPAPCAREPTPRLDRHQQHRLHRSDQDDLRRRRCGRGHLPLQQHRPADSPH